ncbi:calcium/sodium antiporter [Porphyrobacter algicida]|uniref:Calcium/sodium antiporter n=1 Tax=Qipengyuania algicida TaxID=1836209 RepID=A0A845AIK6_9SPHN|nr:calcium/sodium antiporter [Qipengyuania algicida]MXP29434.1 calcium/sodium antiporter [Qipengyuania algicida]
MITAIALVAAGLVLLVVGGELLVRGAVGLAEKAGVSPLVIGLAIVGFGTSMPELVTSVDAAMAGSPAIAWGNVLGSNIANSLLILGAAALVAPLAITSKNRWRDPGVALGASVTLLLLAVSGTGSVLIGAALVAGLFGYIAWCYREERLAEPAIVHNAPYNRAQALEMADTWLHPAVVGWTKPVLFTLVGLAVLVGGGRLLVSGAIDLARLAGLTETLIGLTIVAIGTSLPELVTSVIAARKGESGVAFGNVVGSNIYNILGIGGATMLLSPGAIPSNLLPLDISLVLLTAVAILALALFRGVPRLYAIALLFTYCAYFSYLISNAGYEGEYHDVSP